MSVFSFDIFKPVSVEILNPSAVGYTNTGVSFAVPSSLIRRQFDKLRF